MLISDVFGDLRCSRRGSRPALRGPTEKGTLNLGRMDLELLLGILEISDRFPKPLAESPKAKKVSNAHSKSSQTDSERVPQTQDTCTMIRLGTNLKKCEISGFWAPIYLGQKRSYFSTSILPDTANSGSSLRIRLITIHLPSTNTKMRTA